jgi:nucleoid DNA-binding protein
MNKLQIIKRIVKTSRIREPIVAIIVRDFIENIIESIKRGENVHIEDLGVFKTRICPPSKAHNPKTLEKVMVPARRKMYFSVSKCVRMMLKSLDVESESSKTETS